MRHVARLVVLSTLVLLVGLLPARAQPREGFQLEARIPASTMAFVSLEDVGSWATRLQETAIGQLMADEEMQAFLKPLLEAAEGMQGEVLGQLPPPVLSLLRHLEHLKGQLAVAFVGMDPDTQMPLAVASLDFGDHVGDFTTFVDRMREEMDPDGRGFRRTETEERVWWSLDMGGFPIHATVVDTAFVLGSDRGLLEQVIAGGNEGSLAAAAPFQDVVARTGGGDRMVFLYGNVAAALGTFGDMMPPQAAGMVSALGLDTIEAIAYATAWKGDGFRDTLLVHAPGADHGILPLGRMKPLESPTSLELVPASAFAWHEENTPLQGLLDRLRLLMLEVDPSEVEQLNQGLAQARRFLGVDIENELLAGLDDNMAFYAGLPPAGGLFPEVALMLRVKDPAAFEPLFARMADNLAGNVTEQGRVIATTRTMPYRGTTMHLFEMQRAEGDEPVPFTPTWALIGNRLVITLVPYTMKEIALRAEEGVRDGGLAGQEDFASLMALKPASAGGMTYIDLQRLVTAAYDTLVPLAQTLIKPNMLEDVPFTLDWAALPPARRVAKHFRSLATFTTWDDDGVAIAIQSPVPLVPALVAVGAGAALLWSRAGHAESVRWAEATPPREIGGEMDLELARLQAQMLADVSQHYRAEHGAWPTTLDALVEADLMDALPRDPWGGGYRLRRVEDGVLIESAGPDQVFDTADDVSQDGS